MNQDEREKLAALEKVNQLKDEYRKEAAQKAEAAAILQARKRAERELATMKQLHADLKANNLLFLVPFFQGDVTTLEYSCNDCMFFVFNIPGYNPVCLHFVTEYSGVELTRAEPVFCFVRRGYQGAMAEIQAINSVHVSSAYTSLGECLSDAEDTEITGE